MTAKLILLNPSASDAAALRAEFDRQLTLWQGLQSGDARELLLTEYDTVRREIAELETLRDRLKAEVRAELDLVGAIQTASFIAFLQQSRKPGRLDEAGLAAAIGPGGADLIAKYKVQGETYNQVQVKAVRGGAT